MRNFLVPAFLMFSMVGAQAYSGYPVQKNYVCEGILSIKNATHTSGIIGDKGNDEENCYFEFETKISNEIFKKCGEGNMCGVRADVNVFDDGQHKSYLIIKLKKVYKPVTQVHVVCEGEVDVTGDEYLAAIITQPGEKPFGKKPDICSFNPKSKLGKRIMKACYHDAYHCRVVVDLNLEIGRDGNIYRSIKKLYSVRGEYWGENEIDTDQAH